MNPLHPIAMGLAIVMVFVGIEGYDALPDVAGWLLVLLGVRDVRVERRQALLTLAAVSLVLSVVLWWPAVRAWLEDQHPSLPWAVNLPQVAFLGLLAHELCSAARTHGDAGAAGWWRIVSFAAVVMALLPVVLAAAGAYGLLPASYVVATLTLFTAVVLLTVHAGRPWARSHKVS